jgi:8-oxo-dGTP diphosphatase
MLNDLLGGIWRRVPKRLRHLTLGLSHPRFAATAGAVIIDDQGRVLLLKHRFRPGSGWGMPGGYLEKGEQPQAALRRELREEAGLEVEKVELVFVRTFRKPRQLEIIFRCRAVGETSQLNYEIQKAAWFAPDELPAGLPKDQQQLIKMAMNDGASPQD